MNTGEKILFNQFGRLRSGWRFLIFFFALIFVAGIGQSAIAEILGHLPLGFTANSVLSMVAMALAGFGSAIFCGWLCNRYLEGLPFKALGTSFTKRWFSDLLIGLVFGVAAICFAILLGALFGGLRFSLNSNVGSAAILASLQAAVLIFISGSIYEEAFARGYMFQTFVRAGIPWVGLLISSTIFALGHGANPNSSGFALINTLLAGAVLAFSYLRTRTLWFPYGWHFAWNFVQGPIFGIEVSGLTKIFPAPILVEHDSGPAWLTGGQYGIEGGLVCTIALIFAAVAIHFAKFLRPSPQMLALTDHENPVESPEVWTEATRE